MIAKLLAKLFTIYFLFNRYFLLKLLNRDIFQHEEDDQKPIEEELE